MEKVILISIDGMRPNAFLACGNPCAAQLQRISAVLMGVRRPREWEGRSLAE